VYELVSHTRSSLQSELARQPTHRMVAGLQRGSDVGHVPPSAQEGTHVRVIGSHAFPALQSPSTPHWTHWCSAVSQRGKPGCVHWSLSTHATHCPDVVSQ